MFTIKTLIECKKQDKIEDVFWYVEGETTVDQRVPSTYMLEFNCDDNTIYGERCDRTLIQNINLLIMLKEHLILRLIQFNLNVLGRKMVYANKIQGNIIHSQDT